jgi:hypothetical protein
MLFASFLSCALLAAAPLPEPPRIPVAYVDPAGNDTTGDGSPANPFRTLQRAHDAVDPGGTVRARAGAYPFALAVSKTLLIERDGTGVVTVGPPNVGTVTVTVAAADVTLRDLTFAGGATVRGLELTSGDRLVVERCAFAGTALGAVRIAAALSTGHRLAACSFSGVRATPAAIAVAASNSSQLLVEACSFREGDFALRLEACADARISACTFVDHFQSALVATGSVDLVVEGCRFSRCAHFPTPGQRAVPAESLGTVALVAGSARARVLRTVIEDCGGYTGNNTFRTGATIRFDGLFGVSVHDSTAVAVQDCSFHRNRFGGIWVGGASAGLTATRCNFVANGTDNDPGKDVAMYSNGLVASAVNCFFGVSGGPTFDGAGFGNGLLGGSISFMPPAAAPYDAPAFGVAPARTVPGAERSVAMAVGDLTGDGWNELVVAGDRSGTVEVHVNAPAGFVAREIMTLPSARPIALAVGLFDADALRDVAVLDELGQRVVVMFGDGTGRLPTTRAAATGRHPVRLAAGELNGQVGAELVIACQGDAFGPGAMLVLRNDGTGTFTSTALPGAVAPCAVALLDLDADTDLDVVGFDLDPAGPGLRRWLNDGAGAFGAVQATPVDAHPTADASLAVIDQDGGALDLAVASFQLLPLPGVARVRLFRGNGTGGFAAPLELRQRAAPLELLVAALGSARPSLLAIDRSAHMVVALGPIASDAGATFPYAQTFADIPLQVAVGPITNRTTADVAVAEAGTGQVVTQRGRRVASTETYGLGCTGTAGVPKVRVASTPAIGSATFAMGFDGAAASSAAVMLLGAVPLDITLPGGCKLLVDSLLSLGAASDASGAAALAFPIPDFGGLLGANLFTQWFILDPGGGLFGALSMTPGLRVVIGG